MQSLAEIRSLLSRHVVPGEKSEPLPGIRLVGATAPTELISAVYEPAFALVAQGAKRAVLGNRMLDYGSGQYLVVPVDLPVAGQVVRASKDEPYLALALTLRSASIATLLLEMGSSERRVTEGLGLSVSVAHADLLDPVARLLRLLDRPDDIAVLGPLLEREILWRLLAGEQGGTVRQIGLADSRLAQISRAIQWIRAHYTRILRIDELADVAGMSLSSFYRHFRAVTSMSALQYQKQIRLQEARARLIADAKDVAAVGFDVGYDSPSQFSREYSRLFGVPPGRDMKRLRGEAKHGQDFMP